MPPNMASLIQALNQDMIKRFQGTLCQGALSQALEALSTNKETTILEYWKSVTICNIIDHISTAWDSIKQATISNCWGNIWPN